MEKIYSEVRGSWRWSVQADLLGGAVAIKGEREKAGVYYDGIVLKVFPAEATGLGPFSNLGLTTLVGWLGGVKVRAEFKKALERVKQALGR